VKTVSHAVPREVYRVYDGDAFRVDQAAAAAPATMGPAAASSEPGSRGAGIAAPLVAIAAIAGAAALVVLDLELRSGPVRHRQTGARRPARPERGGVSPSSTSTVTISPTRRRPAARRRDRRERLAKRHPAVPTRDQLGAGVAEPSANEPAAQVSEFGFER
jgi:hypothetical protein